MTTTAALSWIAEVFHAEPHTITPETPREDVAEWDSLGILALMAALDSDFGLVLTDEDLAGLNRVQDVLEVLRNAGKLSD